WVALSRRCRGGRTGPHLHTVEAPCGARNTLRATLTKNLPAHGRTVTCEGGGGLPDHGAAEVLARVLHELGVAPEPGRELGTERVGQVLRLAVRGDDGGPAAGGAGADELHRLGDDVVRGPLSEAEATAEVIEDEDLRLGVCAAE